MRYTFFSMAVVLTLFTVCLNGIILADTSNVEIPNTRQVSGPFAINYILVDNETDLSDQASDNGWPGDGSEDDPYLISNYTFDGTSQVAGIYIGNTTSHITIYNCTISNLITSTSIAGRSSGIYLNYTSDVNIMGCTIEEAKHGIYVNFGTRTSISNTTAHNVDRTDGSGITFAVNSDSDVRDCDISGFGSGVILYFTLDTEVSTTTLNHSKIHINLFGADRNKVFGNTMIGDDTTGNNGILLSQSDQNVITDNNITNFSRNIYLNTCLDNTVLSNIIEGGGDGIYLLNGDRNYIESNILQNGTGNGIEVSRRGQTIKNNVVRHYGGIGISWVGSNSMDLSYNEVTNNIQGGIYVGGSSSFVTGNSVSKNGIYGIAVSRSYTQLWYDRSIHVFSNIITDNQGVGIIVENRNGNQISGNLIANNSGYGIDIKRNSMGNRITNNSIIHNQGSTQEYGPDQIQALSVSGNDLWYENQRGNYWYDWTKPDDDENGIVDVPYMINSGSSIKDPYPLTESYFLPDRPLNLSARMSGTHVELSWLAPRSQFEIENYTLYRSELGGELEPIAIIDPSNTSHFDLTSRMETTYVYAISASVIYGNGKTSNTVMIATPPVLPVVNILSPDEGVFLNNYNFQLRWEAWDDESGLDTIEIRLFDDDWLDVGEARSYSFQKLLYDTGKLELEGEFTFDVRVVDHYGGAAEDRVSFVIDTTLPELELLSPLPVGYYQTDTVEISWRAKDDATGILGYELRIDDREWIDMGMNETFTAEGLHDGSHKIEIKAYDGAGNVITGEYRFSVDMTAPELEITEPTSQYYYNADVIRLEWSGRDHFSGIDHYTWGPAPDQQTDVGKNTKVVLNNLEEGEHTYWVFAYDRAGNQNSTSIDLFIDLYRPDLNVIFPVDGGVYDFNDMTASWDGRDSGSGIDRFEYYLDNLEGTTQDTEVRLEGLEEGKHTFTVIVYDLLGNVEQEKVSFTVDTIDPTVLSFNPFEGPVEVDVDINIIFSEPMNMSSVMVTWETGGDLNWIDERMVRIDHPPLDHAGSYRLEITGSDIAGNQMENVSFSFNTTDVGYVYGSIIDEDGTPIPWADVFVHGGQEVSANGTGYFILKERAGEYTITISSLNYENKTFIVNILPGEESDIGTIVLRSDQEDEGNDNILIWSMLWILAIIVILILFMFFIIWRKNRSRPEFGHEDIKIIMDHIRTSHGMMTAEEIENTDFYNILDLQKKANMKQIRSAYRGLAAKHHPDKLINLSEEERRGSEDKMVKINMAKAVLMDPGSKGAYDHFLESREMMKKRRK
ncbi:MAG: right-handed parallel beta-helix repeat-containing protein [Thermoplasmata archaeon]|nr:right-handed parallel beta-helix repeat-containing protein [Thermoplasmata archaeon]